MISCRLKKLHLCDVNVVCDVKTLDVKHSRLLEGKEKSFSLSELIIVNVVVASELFNWLCLSLNDLRVLHLGPIGKKLPHGESQPCAAQLLDFIARANAHTLEELHLIPMNDEFLQKEFLQSLRNFFESCPNMHTVMSRVRFLKDDDDRDDRLVEFLAEGSLGSLRDTCISMALFEAVLDVPKLRRTDFFTDHKPQLQVFCELLANRGKKWPGTSLRDPSSLIIEQFTGFNAAYAATVFRRRNLDFRMKCVGELEYEVWFPPAEMTD